MLRGGAKPPRWDRIRGYNRQTTLDAAASLGAASGLRVVTPVASLRRFFHWHLRDDARLVHRW
jgi:hypothetical protein